MNGADGAAAAASRRARHARNAITLSSTSTAAAASPTPQPSRPSQSQDSNAASSPRTSLARFRNASSTSSAVPTPEALAALGTSLPDLLASDPDTLFMTNDVRTLSSIQAVLQRISEETSAHLRAMVSHRYRDLLGTADTVIDMGLSSRGLVARLETVRDGIEHAAQRARGAEREEPESPNRALISQHETAEASSKLRHLAQATSQLHALAAALKLVQEAPESARASLDRLDRFLMALGAKHQRPTAAAGGGDTSLNGATQKSASGQAHGSASDDEEHMGLLQAANEAVRVAVILAVADRAWHWAGSNIDTDLRRTFPFLSQQHAHLLGMRAELKRRVLDAAGRSALANALPDHHPKTLHEATMLFLLSLHILDPMSDSASTLCSARLIALSDHMRHHRQHLPASSRGPSASFPSSVPANGHGEEIEASTSHNVAVLLDCVAQTLLHLVRGFGVPEPGSKAEFETLVQRSLGDRLAQAALRVGASPQPPSSDARAIRQGEGGRLGARAARRVPELVARTLLTLPSAGLFDSYLPAEALQLLSTDEDPHHATGARGAAKVNDAKPATPLSVGVVGVEDLAQRAETWSEEALAAVRGSMQRELDGLENVRQLARLRTVLDAAARRATRRACRGVTWAGHGGGGASSPASSPARQGRSAIITGTMVAKRGMEAMLRSRVERLQVLAYTKLAREFSAGWARVVLEVRNSCERHATNGSAAEEERASRSFLEMQPKRHLFPSQPTNEARQRRSSRGGDGGSGTAHRPSPSEDAVAELRLALQGRTPLVEAVLGGVERGTRRTWRGVRAFVDHGRRDVGNEGARAEVDSGQVPDAALWANHGKELEGMLLGLADQVEEQLECLERGCLPGYRVEGQGPEEAQGGYRIEGPDDEPGNAKASASPLTPTTNAEVLLGAMLQVRLLGCLAESPTLRECLGALAASNDDEEKKASDRSPGGRAEDERAGDSGGAAHGSRFDAYEARLRALQRRALEAWTRRRLDGIPTLLVAGEGRGDEAWTHAPSAALLGALGELASDVLDLLPLASSATSASAHARLVEEVVVRSLLERIPTASGQVETLRAALLGRGQESTDEASSGTGWRQGRELLLVPLIATSPSPRGTGNPRVSTAERQDSAPNKTMGQTSAPSLVQLARPSEDGTMWRPLVV